MLPGNVSTAASSDDFCCRKIIWNPAGCPNAASNATHSTEENAMISLLNSDFFSPEILRQNGNHYECGRMPNSEGGGGCPWTGSDGFPWIFLKNLDENASTHVEFWQLSARKGSIFTVVIDWRGHRGGNRDSLTKSCVWKEVPKPNTSPCPSPKGLSTHIGCTVHREHGTCSSTGDKACEATPPNQPYR